MQLASLSGVATPLQPGHNHQVLAIHGEFEFLHGILCVLYLWAFMLVCRLDSATNGAVDSVGAVFVACACPVCFLLLSCLGCSGHFILL